MGIRKPAVSVQEARRLAAGQSERSFQESMLASSNPPVAIAPIEPTIRQTGNRIVPARALPARRTVLLSNERHDADPKVQVFLSAALPARGISATFDALSAESRPAKALQMILRRALDDYELMLSNGSFAEIAPAYSVEEPLAIVATSRMMPRRLVDIALAHFDPLGFKSARAFGRKLASSALCIFFDNEKKVTHRQR
ncbi:virulence protein [Mesorhizobium erdmanii]|uniref:Virulence protein n=2 Tax=Mesorhizobium TaxID=68287 RepID=A0A3M9X0U5_9HYPH|nr:MULTISPECIES: conjugal transfer protein VirC2 [Mesorhizobium]RNJ41465.1 virulence protein [Mesorhizobium japonicum]RXT53347.1 virulence protein [Mesorhizobium erdmanii]